MALHAVPVVEAIERILSRHELDSWVMSDTERYSIAYDTRMHMI